MKKPKKLTAEFWKRDRENKAKMEAYVAKLEQRIAERKAHEQAS